jgi:drug/metabolite transporter (DMT)-like permease
MGMFLIILGTFIGFIGVLSVLGSLTNNIALAVALLLCVVGAVLLGAGAIVEAIDKLRRATAPPKQPKV